MELYQLQPDHPLKKKKRVGRGGKRGTYCGRGSKGQKSRAGRKMQPMIRQFIKRYPKKRGYRVASFRDKPLTISLSILEKNFEKGEIVNMATLVEKKLLERVKSRKLRVKILARGELKKALIIDGIEFSNTAKEKIEKAGGEIKN